MYLLLVFLSLIGSCFAGLCGRHLGSWGSAIIITGCLFLSFLIVSSVDNNQPMKRLINWVQQLLSWVQQALIFISVFCIFMITLLVLFAHEVVIIQKKPKLLILILPFFIVNSIDYYQPMKRLIHWLQQALIFISVFCTFMITLLVLFAYGAVIIFTLDEIVDLNRKIEILEESIKMIIFILLITIEFFVIIFFIRPTVCVQLSHYYKDIKRDLPIFLIKIKKYLVKVLGLIITKIIIIIYVLVSVWCFVHTIYTVYTVFF